MTPPLALIVAMADNGVIGKANGLPWHISADLKRFRALTMGKPLLMGRKTFESIGRVLPGRETIVVSRNRDFAAPDAVFRAANIDEGLELARQRAKALGADEIMLVGGGELYAALIDRADRLYVTFVHAKPEGDAYFPPLDWAQWQEVCREDHPAEKPGALAFSFVDFRRS